MTFGLTPLGYLRYGFKIKLKNSGEGMKTYFRNPSNQHVEVVDWTFWGTLLLGPLFFALRGVWGWAFLSLILALITAGIAWLFIPFAAHGIVNNHYLNKGWEQITKEDLERETDVQAMSASESLLGFFTLVWLGGIVFAVMDGVIVWYYALVVAIVPAFLSSMLDKELGDIPSRICSIGCWILVPVAWIQIFIGPYPDVYEFWQVLTFCALALPVCFFNLAMLPLTMTIGEDSPAIALGIDLIFKAFLLVQAAILFRFGILGIPQFAEINIIGLEWWAVCLVYLSLPLLFAVSTAIVIFAPLAWDEFFVTGDKKRQPPAPKVLSDEAKEIVLDSLGEGVDQVRILVAFARADGRMVAAERNIILAFIREEFEVGASDEELHEFIKRTKVSKKQLQAAVRSANSDEILKEKILGWAAKLREEDKSKDGSFDDLWKGLVSTNVLPFPKKV